MSHIVGFAKNGLALVLGGLIVVGVQNVVHNQHEADRAEQALSRCIAGKPIFDGIPAE